MSNKRHKYFNKVPPFKPDPEHYTRKQQTRERIGGRIATLRRLRGLTQEQLAQEAGLQRTHVNRIEAGKYAVTIDVVQAIAQVLGMTVDLIDPALQDLAPLRKLTPDK